MSLNSRLSGPSVPWLCALLMSLSAAQPVWAQAAAPSPAPAPNGVLTLTTSATIEVTKDVLSVALSVTRDGADAQAVQAAVKQALEAALTEARKVARPGQVDVQTGNLSLYPRYASGTSRAAPSIVGWQGSAELLVQGKDVATIAQLAGRINTMTIARVGYQLSREAREKVEADAIATAIARWRAKAQQMSEQFGYKGYVVREVNVATNEPGTMHAPVAMRAKLASASMDEALPTEAGRGEVSASVSGAVQMTR